MKRIGFVLHSERSVISEVLEEFQRVCTDQGIESFEYTDSSDAPDVVIVLGGDGTILRTCELVIGTDIPILGFNLGRVGFLAQAHPTSISETINRLKLNQFNIEERSLAEVIVLRDRSSVYNSFALNEVSVEKDHSDIMIELKHFINDTVLTAWAGDGVIVATPSGSTAYAFSAGGPIVFPNVSCLVMVPICAHALFAKPIAFSMDSKYRVQVHSDAGILNLDGRRTFHLEYLDDVIVTGSDEKIRFIRFDDTDFTERLVQKFRLPTIGWRETHDA
ncbi:MAG: NAD(+)/NADH kinase [Candidatus Nanopelagicales bacterium]